MKWLSFNSFGISNLYLNVKDDKNKFGVTAVGGVRGEDVSKKKEKVKSDELEWE